jgi:hypothetical protein
LLQFNIFLKILLHWEELPVILPGEDFHPIIETTPAFAPAKMPPFSFIRPYL